MRSLLAVSDKNAQMGTSADQGRLPLDTRTHALLRSALPAVAQMAVEAITVEVPSYRHPFSGVTGTRIRGAVELALVNFLIVASSDADPSVPIERSASAAYELGRGEARSGRSMDALLAAYRIGARVSWRELSRVAVASGMPAATVGRFAELVFSYIDELSAASISGHTDELETAGRVRERHLERLGRYLLASADAATLEAAADRATWVPPATLTAVILSGAHAPRIAARLDPTTLLLAGDLPGLDDDMTLLLVPDATGYRRERLAALLEDQGGCIGPTRPWREVRASYDRALRGLHLPRHHREVVDTEERLVDLVLLADEQALDDLRARVLAPFADLRPAQRSRLLETLRSWLLHRGSRDRVAADLFVHPHTVRYRLGQVRSLYGESLDDPRTMLGLTLALGILPTTEPA